MIDLDELRRRRTLVQRTGEWLHSLLPQKPRWLWEPYVPLGGLTILEGDPGTGKSTFLAWLAAQVSNGWKEVGRIRFLPDTFRQGNVMLCSLEDDARAIIAPRLIATGADSDSVYVLGPDFQLDDVDATDRLEGLIGLYKPILVILDPLESFLGYTDTHRGTSVRMTMKDIILLSQEKEFALVASRHLTKSARGKKIYRGLGSISGFTGLARSVLQVEEVRGEEGHTYRVEQIQNNYGRLGIPMYYHIEEFEIDRDEWTGTLKDILEAEPGERDDIICTSRVVFEARLDEPAHPGQEEKREPTKTEQAMALLQELLDEHGDKVAAGVVMAEAKKRGLDVKKQMWETVRKRLEVESVQESDGHYWLRREGT